MTDRDTENRELHRTTPIDSDEPPPRRHTGRIIAIAIAVLLVIVIIFFVRHRSAAAAQAKAKEAARAKPATPVSTVVARQQDVPVYLNGLGNVNALNTVTVKTRIDGQLVRFDFQEGQLVHAGQELALIDPRPSEAALAQAEATRFKDQATLENARRDLERYQGLYKAGVISQQQYNTQQSLVVVNEGAVRADDAAVQTARLDVIYCHIQAPIDGRVGIRFVDPGNMVHASDPNGLLVITEMQPIAVLFTLPEDNLPPVTQHMKDGLPVEAWSRDNSQKIADGKLLTIDNQIDPNTGTFRLKSVFPNTNGALFPNQFVNARLRVEVRHNAITIPAAAIQHGPQGTFVYVVKEDTSPAADEAPAKDGDAAGAKGKSADKAAAGDDNAGAKGDPPKSKYIVEARPVAIALTEGLQVVIGSGLQAGEQVVVDGADKLQPKSRVEPKAATRAPRGTDAPPTAPQGER